MADIEAPLRARVRAALEDDFILHEGYRGRHKHGGELVKYDLVAVPREHLIRQNFDHGCFIIEVKRFNIDDKKAHDTKARDLMWQCVAYSFSEVELPDGTWHRPLFVCYYIDGTGIQKQHAQELLTLRNFVQRGGVGHLELHPRFGWGLIFGSSYYFRQSKGKGPHNVGTKRQTGSSR